MNGYDLHPVVRAIVEDYLRSVDALAPGLVTGLYLVGSVALGDFHPRRSDIDFVAVTSTAPSGAQITALRRVHAGLAARHRRPYFDGTYLTHGDLAGDPALAPPGPYVHEHRLHPASRADRHPVCWHQLARHGLPVRGPVPGELAVWTDPDALRRWTLGNLESYWRPWWRGCTRSLSRGGLWCLSDAGVAWGVLGVSRLLFTLDTGEITTKRGAGGYARGRFGPRWHRIVDECLRIRLGDPGHSLYRTRRARRREALDFVAMAIDEATRDRADHD